MNTIKITNDTSLSSITAELEKHYPALKFLFIDKYTLEGDFVGSFNMMLNDKVALCEAVHLLNVLPSDIKVADIYGNTPYDKEFELKIDSSTSITDLINHFNQLGLTMAIRFKNAPWVVVGGNGITLKQFNDWVNMYSG